MVQFRDDESPTGWTALIAEGKTRTAPIASSDDATTAAVDPRSKNVVTAKRLKSFQDWRTETYRQAFSNSANKNAELPEDLTPTERHSVEKKVAAERERLIGQMPIMTLKQYLEFSGSCPDSLAEQQALASLPKGKTLEEIFVSADQALTTHNLFQLRYHARDAGGALVPVKHDTSTTISNGTSWATPIAAAKHAAWQREQVAAAKAAERTPR